LDTLINAFGVIGQTTTLAEKCLLASNGQKTLSCIHFDNPKLNEYEPLAKLLQLKGGANSTFAYK